MVLYTVFPKRPRVAHMFNHGWWRLAVGGWWRLAVGAGQLAVGGGWWRLVVPWGGLISQKKLNLHGQPEKGSALVPRVAETTPLAALTRARLLQRKGGGWVIHGNPLAIVEHSPCPSHATVPNSYGPLPYWSLDMEILFVFGFFPPTQTVHQVQLELSGNRSRSRAYSTTEGSTCSIMPTCPSFTYWTDSVHYRHDLLFAYALMRCHALRL